MNMLRDYDTGEAIRPATREEWEASVSRAYVTDDEAMVSPSRMPDLAGVIVVDGRHCYVDGEVWVDA